MISDALALLAISQLVCIGAIAYLYLQVQALQRSQPRRRVVPGSAPARPAPSAQRTAQAAFESHPRRAAAGPPLEASSLAARLGDRTVDVAALALRMGKSEEEVRLLMRRRGIAS